MDDRRSNTDEERPMMAAAWPVPASRRSGGLELPRSQSILGRLPGARPRWNLAAAMVAGLFVFVSPLLVVGALSLMDASRPWRDAGRVAPSARVSTPRAAALPCSPPTIDLRVLVVAATGDEPALAGIRQALEFNGTPHTVWVASDAPGALTPDRLADGCHGAYQAILLTSTNLARDPSHGGGSGLIQAEWEALWDYAQAFGIRQVSWFADPTPDLGLEWPVDRGTGPVEARLTAEGRAVFAYLRDDAVIPIRDVKRFPSRPLGDGRTVSLLADARGNALAAIRTYGDGREHLVFTFEQRPNDLHHLAVAYGAINWATRGLFLGERRVHLSAHVDDVFIRSSIWTVETPCGSAPTASDAVYRMDGDDLRAIDEWQRARQAHPTASAFRLDFAFNANGTTGLYGADTLTPAATADPERFKWISHTLTHRNLDNVDFATALTEVVRNDEIARELGLRPYTIASLVTPEVSGLTNPQFLQAAHEAGVRYLVSDTSRPGYDNPTPNAGIYHQAQPSLLMIPRRPTDLFFNVSTPAEWVAEFNCMYVEKLGRELTYDEILDRESRVLLGYLLKGDVDPVMFHQANLRAYDGTRTLLGDVLDRTLDRYQALFTLPIESPTMDELGRRMADRMAYNAAGVRASVVPGQSITLVAEQLATVPVTGLDADGAETYGGQPIAHVRLEPGQPLTLPLR